MMQLKHAKIEYLRTGIVVKCPHYGYGHIVGFKNDGINRDGELLVSIKYASLDAVTHEHLNQNIEVFTTDIGVV